jgi:hypothetical protein
MFQEAEDSPRASRRRQLQKLIHTRCVQSTGVTA